MSFSAYKVFLLFVVYGMWLFVTRMCSSLLRKLLPLLSLSSCETNFLIFFILPISLRWSDNAYTHVETLFWHFDVGFVLFFQMLIVTITDWHPLLPCSWRHVSWLRNFRKQHCNVRLHVNDSPHALLILVAVWEILWQALNPCQESNQI